MQDQLDQWLPIPAAAAMLGITENAVRIRVRKNRLLASRDNHGRIVVCLTKSGPDSSSLVQPTNADQSPTTIESADVPETMPVSLHREMVERLQAQHAAALTAVQTMHQDLVNRLQAQSAMERGLWLERIDAAELRAEAFEAKLDKILDRLLTERQSHRWTNWFSQWFGASKKQLLSN